METVAIAGIDEALTFARIKDNFQKRVIAVKRYQAGRVYDVDLSIELKRPVEEIWKHRRTQWTHKGQPISLLGDSQYIPDRILIMSGTPKGVVFRGVPTQQRIAGFLAGVMGGWGQSVPFHALEAYIDDAKAARIYLQPGDRVVIHTDRLGIIENIITR